MNENDECELRGYRIDCSGGQPQNHHLFSRQKLRKAKKAKIYCEETHPEIFIRKVCANHNVSRIADTKWARRVFVKLSASPDMFGIEYVRDIIDNVPWEPIPCPELSYKAIKSAPLPED